MTPRLSLVLGASALLTALACAGGEVPVEPVPVTPAEPAPTAAPAGIPDWAVRFDARTLPITIDAANPEPAWSDAGALALTDIKPWLTASELEGQIEPPVRPIGTFKVGDVNVWLALVDLPWGGGVTSYRALVATPAGLELTELASNEGVYCESGSRTKVVIGADGNIAQTVSPWTQNCDLPEEPITEGTPVVTAWTWNGKGWTKTP
jgi:hypothetical protein